MSTLLETYVSMELDEGFVVGNITGIDTDAEREFADRLSAIKTQADKDRILDAIDELVDNSNRIITQANPVQYGMQLLGSMLTGGLYGLLSFIIRIANGSERKRFRERLLAIRSQVVAKKI